VGVGFLVAEEEALDEGAAFELDLGSHFFHVEDCLMLVEAVGDVEGGEYLEALLAVGGEDLGHVGIILMKSIQ
jgi:hypothetical protein